jgi:hypothetical protein
MANHLIAGEPCLSFVLGARSVMLSAAKHLIALDEVPIAAE